MQLAMEALAQEEERHAVHVEVVAAPGTTGKSRIGRNREKDDEPDGKDYLHGMVRRRHLESQPHGRDVDQDYHPQVPAAPADANEAIPRTSSLVVPRTCLGCTMAAISSDRNETCMTTA